jgi:hypothetical protein
MQDAWNVEFTNEFESLWEGLRPAAQEAIAASVQLLEHAEPNLGFPHCSAINASKYTHMRELRVHCKGRPIMVSCAFDPRRVSILRIGGDKTGIDRWYGEYVPIADELYRIHLTELKNEGLKNDKKFSSLRAKMSPESRVRSSALAEAMLVEIKLVDLRRTRAAT